jgi:trans-2-enoyl-CoA reductase
MSTTNQSKDGPKKVLITGASGLLGVAAAVVTYMRNAWGNAAAAVSPDQVRTIRGK